jgi:hypothetical protein
VDQVPRFPLKKLKKDSKISAQLPEPPWEGAGTGTDGYVSTGSLTVGKGSGSGTGTEMFGELPSTIPLHPKEDGGSLDRAQISSLIQS